MLLRYLSAAALALQSVNAFRDASPFVLYSTSQLDIETTNTNVLSAQSLNKAIESQLKGCPSDTYVVVSQPGVSASDLSASKSTLHLRRRISNRDANIKSVFTVNNVVGEVSASELVTKIESSCGKDSWSNIVLDGEKGEIPTKPYNTISVHFSDLPATKDDRESALLQADSYLNSLLDTLDSYTLLYATTPSTTEPEAQHPEQYEMDDQYPADMHIDLKRDLDAHVRRASNKSSSTNPQSELPLFEKYQFLSAGIFMGGAVSILLFSILYVGVSAIANLEVSYMAFSKEMGPAAQKKQQQQQ